MTHIWAAKAAERKKKEDAEQRHREEVQLMRAQKLAAHSSDLWYQFTSLLDENMTNFNVNLTGEMHKPYRFSRRSDGYVVVERPDGQAVVHELAAEYKAEANRVDATVSKGSGISRTSYPIDVDESGNLYFKAENKSLSADGLAERLLEALIF